MLSFTRRLIEIAAIAGARGSGISPTAALNAMRLPAIALDWRGLILDVNAAADTVFDDDVKIKDKHLFVRDCEARAFLKASLDELTNPVKQKSLIAEPIIVQRRDKLPIILRIWPIEGPTHSSEEEVYALLTLNALGPKPGPPAPILAKTFRTFGSEARLHHRAGRPSRYRRPRIEDFPGDGPLSVEIRVQNSHFGSYITFKTSMTDETLRWSMPWSNRVPLPRTHPSSRQRFNAWFGSDFRSPHG